MALHYIVDGYNVIKQAPSLKTLELKQARHSFLRFIQASGVTGSRRNKITVVFDGSGDCFSRTPVDEFAGVNCVFSQGESADDKIIDLIKSSPNPKIAVLISDDRALGLSARSLGADVMSVAGFFAKADKPPRQWFGFSHKPEGNGLSSDRQSHRQSHKKTAALSDDAAKLSSRQEREITEELEKIWLRKKQS